MDYDKYKVDIPEGQSGEWRIEKFTVSEQEAKFSELRAKISFSDRGRPVKAGIYTRLLRNGTLVMSDTPAEIDDHYGTLRWSRGNVLLNGLGLGVALKIVLGNQGVKKVFVNELSEDVIKLVRPYFTDDRVVINHADAFEWKPPRGTRFGMIWHDIWDNICEDNLPEMKKLHRKYGHYLDKGGEQGSWGRDLLDDH